MADRHYVINENDIQRFIKELLHERNVFTDTTINLTGIDVSVRKMLTEIQELQNKPDQIKSYLIADKSIIFKVPKRSKDSLDISIDALTTNDKTISFSVHIPSQYVHQLRDTPFVTYASKYTLDTMQTISTIVDNKSNTDYDFIKLSFPRDITAGVCTLISADRYIEKNDTLSPVFAGLEDEISSEPPAIKQDIPSPELLVRSHSVKWVEGIKRSDFVLLELAKLTNADTLYHVRDDDKQDNLTFKFTSREEARRIIPELWKTIPTLWNLVTFEFDDSVTNIDSLFSNSVPEGETEATFFTTNWPKLPEGINRSIRAITGNNITSAQGLYEGTKISSISNGLLKGMPNLQNIDAAFANIRDIVTQPSVDLIRDNKKLISAEDLFYNSNITEDPGYWKLKTFDTYPNLLNYMTDTPAARDITQYIPWPYATPTDGNVKFLTWLNVKQFRDTYQAIFNDISTESDKLVNFEGYEFEILEGNLDEMFYGTSITKLPNNVKAVNAKSAKRFAKNVTTLINTAKTMRVFEKCPQLTDITSAFEGCTGLTEAGDFIGASDTISIYDAVFKDCINIDFNTLAEPWTYAGLDGYPLDVQGVDGYKNIPNLPEWVPIEWGGRGIGTKMNAIRSVTPIVEYCYEGDDYITLDLKPEFKKVGGVFDICMVDATERSTILEKDKRYKFRVTVAEAGRKFIIGLNNFSSKIKLTARDCIRVRYLEPKDPSKPGLKKIWSDFVYQTPIIRTSAKPNGIATPLSYTTWED